MSLEVFLAFFESRSKKDKPKRQNGGEFVRGRYARYLLDTGSEKEENISVFRELFWECMVSLQVVSNYIVEIRNTCKELGNECHQVILACADIV